MLGARCTARTGTRPRGHSKQVISQWVTVNATRDCIKTGPLLAFNILSMHSESPDHTSGRQISGDQVRGAQQSHETASIASTIHTSSQKTRSYYYYYCLYLYWKEIDDAIAVANSHGAGGVGTEM